MAQVSSPRLSRRRRLKRAAAAVVDLLLLPFLYPSAWLLKNIRRVGVNKLPRCRDALLRLGVFPINDHYYEPKFDHRQPRRSYAQDRPLPGIDWNAEGQLALLGRFVHGTELVDVPADRQDELSFYMENDSFGSGDAEYWYQLIRAVKPRRILEIGSGNSTLMAVRAIRRNAAENPDYRCEHVCIEPYEMPWLERSGVTVLRQKAEEVDPAVFARLEANDVLFIDSSHVIRPQGDVLFEYQELLPQLKVGVIVHVHDIFSPKDYPAAWLRDEVRLWNEQYLLEAFLVHNSSWQILGALNWLRHHHYDQLHAVAPFLRPDREPGSFYIQRTG